MAVPRGNQVREPPGVLPSNLPSRFVHAPLRPCGGLSGGLSSPACPVVLCCPPPQLTPPKTSGTRASSSHRVPRALPVGMGAGAGECGDALRRAQAPATCAAGSSWVCGANFWAPLWFLPRSFLRCGSDGRVNRDETLGFRRGKVRSRTQKGRGGGKGWELCWRDWVFNGCSADLPLLPQL